MSNVQKNKQHVTRKPGAEVPLMATAMPVDHTTKKGIDFTIVESIHSSLYHCASVRHLRVCLRSWYLHFASYNVDIAVCDAGKFLELDRFVGELINNCVYEANTIEGVRGIVHEFFDIYTEGQVATRSEAKKMRQAFIEWFAHTIDDFENRADELAAHVHMDAFNTLDSTLNLVICAHEDGIDLYASADVDDAA